MDTSSKNTSSAQQGGANALKGFCYQIFLTIDRAIQESRCMQVLSGSMEEQTVLLVLEPADGGDLTVEKNGYCEIIQIKTSSSKWSLTRIVNKVFPDLFKGIDRKGFSDIKFIFTSPTGFGPKYNGNEFLEEIKNQKDWTCLDQTDRKFLCGETCYTSFALFEYIASQLLGKDKKNDQLHKENVWKLLANFEYHESDDLDTLQKKIKNYLYCKCVPEKQTDDTIAEIVGKLFLRSGEGNQSFLPQVFLEEHLGKGIPVAEENWTQICVNSAERVKDFLRDLGYMEGHDILDNSIRDELIKNSESNVSIITGDSGDGKTWMLHSLINFIASEIESQRTDEVVLYIGGGHGDFQAIEGRIIDEFNIARKDDLNRNLLSLDGVLKRIMGKSKGHFDASVFIDNVYDPNIAEQLKTFFKNRPRIRLVVTCPSISVKQCFEGFGKHHYTTGFTAEKIGEYFSIRGVSKYYSELFVDKCKTGIFEMPSEFFSPLLAHLYCELWNKDEAEIEFYYLFRNYVQNKIKDIGDCGDAIQNVQKIAYEFWDKDDARPAWDKSYLRDKNILPSNCTALTRHGILIALNSSGGLYTVWHSLLLAFFIATEAGTMYAGKRLEKENFNMRIDLLRSAQLNYHAQISEAVQKFFDVIATEIDVDIATRKSLLAKSDASPSLPFSFSKTKTENF